MPVEDVILKKQFVNYVDFKETTIFTLMLKKLNLLVFIAILAVSCGGNDSSLNKEKKKYPVSIVDFNTLLTEEENDVSFPTWFNDSIIKAHRIKKITRKSFPRNKDDEGKTTVLKSTVPREIREFYFNPVGSLIQLNVHNYYDDREIGSVLFSYSGKKDFFGFAAVTRNTFVSKTAKPFSYEESLDPDQRELDFRIHAKRKNYNKCLVYQDMETGDYLFFIPRKKYWGVMSVDSLLAPNPQDVIVLGTPRHPYKKYQVSNKVNEKNVRLFTYQKKHRKVINHFIKKEYPFDYKRDFIFSKKGICRGYIDSTFSDDIFVTRNVSEIQYNKQNEPIRIIHRKENAENETEFFSLELLEYEHY